MKDAKYALLGKRKKKIRQTVEADFSSIYCSSAPLIAGSSLPYHAPAKRTGSLFHPYLWCCPTNEPPRAQSLLSVGEVCC